MRFRGKCITLGVIASLTLSVPAVHGATPRPGNKCSKSGLTAISKGKIYTCIKIGKKNLWDNGRTLVTPSPTPTPTRPAIFQPPTTAPKKISELDASSSWYFAWKSMEDFRTQNATRQIVVQYVIGPNVRADVLQVVKEGINAASTFWSDVWIPSRPVHILIGNERDSNFWEVNLPSDRFRWLSNDYRTLGGRTTYSGSFWENGTPYILIGFGSELSSDYVRKELWQAAPYYYTALVQDSLSGFRTSDLNLLWLSTGQAQQFARFASQGSYLQYQVERSRLLIRSWSNPKELGIRTPTEILNALNPGQVGAFMTNPLSSYGLLAWEALVAIYGHNAVLNFMNRLKYGYSVDEAFNESFGVTPRNFLIQLSPYLSQVRALIYPN